MTLVADEPVPFWEAVDRLCAAGGLRRLYPPAANRPFGLAPAARLRVYRLDRLAADVPFAFDDVPAP